MKLTAHPLIVAAALGLLGPAALAEDEVETESAPCEGCPPDSTSQRATLQRTSEPAVKEPAADPS